MNRALRSILTAFLVTRLALVVTGLATLAWATPMDPGRPFSRPPSTPLLEIWARWDAEWYLDIVERGFRTAPEGGPSWMQPNFFPLYPLVVRAARPVTGSAVGAGVLVSNLAFLVALLLIHDWVSRRGSPTAADRLVWIYCCFPTSFFFSAVYAESLLLALVMAAWWCDTRGQVWSSGISLAFSTWARPVGAFAVPPLIGRTTARLLRGEARRSALAVMVGLPATALIGYLVFAHAVYGDALATMATQVASRGPTRWPWHAFVRLFEEGPAWHGWANSILDASLAIGALALLPVVWRTVGRAEAVFAASVVLLPLSSGLISFARLVLPAFPIFVAMAWHLRGWPLRVGLGTSVVLQMVLFRMFVTWQWVA